MKVRCISEEWGIGPSLEERSENVKIPNKGDVCVVKEIIEERGQKFFVLEGYRREQAFHVSGFQIVEEIEIGDDSNFHNGSIRYD